MEKFVARHAGFVTSILSGFDRLVFRGHLLPLMRAGGMFFFLEAAKVRLLDFKKYVVATSERIKEAALAEATGEGRTVRYLASNAVSKEEQLFHHARQPRAGPAPDGTGRPTRPSGRPTCYSRTRRHWPRSTPRSCAMRPST